MLTQITQTKPLIHTIWIQLKIAVAGKRDSNPLIGKRMQLVSQCVKIGDIRILKQNLCYRCTL